MLRRSFTFFRQNTFRHSPNESVISEKPKFYGVPQNRYPQKNRMFHKKQHWKRGSGMNTFLPLEQSREASKQHVKHIAEKYSITETEAFRRNYTMSQLMRDASARFHEGADDPFVQKGTFQTLTKRHELQSLQGLGDDTPLRTDPSLGLSKLEIAAHGRKGALQNIEPSVPYNKRLSRRMAEGRLWPSIHGTEDRAIAEPKELKNSENMSPSEQRFSAEVEYWLRRNLRAIPAHIADQIDFAEMMIDRCYVSERCKELYIVWSTVSGAARLKIEPILVHLNPWVIRTIKRRMKKIPNIPRVFFVYNSGAIATEMPNKLRHQLDAVLANHSTTIEQRVDYLKQLDSVEHRMRGIPWFMPYLWSKGQKVAKSTQMRSDFVAMKQQKEGSNNSSASTTNGNNNSPGYVS